MGARVPNMVKKEEKQVQLYLMSTIHTQVVRMGPMPLKEQHKAAKTEYDRILAKFVADAEGKLVKLNGVTMSKKVDIHSLKFSKHTRGGGVPFTGSQIWDRCKEMLRQITGTYNP